MRKGTRRVREALWDSRGSEIAEAAVVLPLVFLFIFAILWFGLAFNTWGTVTAAAREGARYASRPASSTSGASGSNWGTTNLPGDNAVDSAVVAILQTARVDPSKIIAYEPPLTYRTACNPPAPPSPPCDTPTTHHITICRFVQVNGANDAQQCGMIVSFQYPFGNGLPFPAYLNFSLQTVTITAVGSSLTQN